MIYLLTNKLTNQKQLFVLDYNYLPMLEDVRIINNANPGFYVENIFFASVANPGNNYTPDQVNGILNNLSNHNDIKKFISKEDFLSYLIYMNLLKDNSTLDQYSDILQKNKLKFLLAAVKYDNKNDKELLAITNYIDYLNDKKSALNLITNSPLHHYEVYNYKIDTFLPYKTKQAALNLLEQLKNEFIEENTHGVITT